MYINADITNQYKSSFELLFKTIFCVLNTDICFYGFVYCCGKCWIIVNFLGLLLVEICKVEIKSKSHQNQQNSYMGIDNHRNIC